MRGEVVSLESVRQAYADAEAARREQDARDAGYHPLVLCRPEEVETMRAALSIKGGESASYDVQGSRWVPERTSYVVSAYARWQLDNPFEVL